MEKNSCFGNTNCSEFERMNERQKPEINLFPAGTASYLCIHQVQSRSDWAAVRRSRWRIHRATIERFISVYIGGQRYHLSAKLLCTTILFYRMPLLIYRQLVPQTPKNSWKIFYGIKLGLNERTVTKNSKKCAKKRERFVVWKEKRIFAADLESEGAKEEIAVAIRLPEKTVYTINNNVRNRRD